MTKSYYSTVFEQRADPVWTIIRDFGKYTWSGCIGRRPSHERRHRQ